MRILMLNNTFPSHAVPNAGTYTQTIEKCLRKTNPDGRTEHCVLSPSGRGIKNKILDYIRFYLHLLFLPLSRYRLLYINHYVFMVPLFLKLPFYKGYVIFHWHGEEVISRRFIMKLLRMAAKVTMPKDALHIVPSEYFKKPVSKWLNLPEDDLEVSPSGGVDTAEFKPAEKQVISEKDTFCIGFASSLLQSKGADIVERMLEHADIIENKTGKKVILHYINYGREAAEWNQRFSRFKDRIQCWKRMPKAEMVHFYQSIDLLLMPSLRESESLGLVALEAMACDVPVIARNLSAFPEFVIPGKTGELLSAEPEIHEVCA